MARRSIRAKSKGDDFEVFHRTSRRMLKWRWLCAKLRGREFLEDI